MKIISPGRQTTVGCIDHLTLSSGDVQDNLKVYVNELSFRDMHRFVSLLFLLHYAGGLATSRPAHSCARGNTVTNDLLRRAVIAS
jgi:hypothetical protein